MLPLVLANGQRPAKSNNIGASHFSIKKTITVPLCTLLPKAWEGLNGALQFVGKDWSGLTGQEGSSPSMRTAARESRAAPRALSCP